MIIDLNSDLGEGFGAYKFGNDEDLLDVVSSANIACGFHGGDPTVMAHTVAIAANRGVAIGAHVSYPDRVGFGRRFVDVSSEDLKWDIVYQIGALDAMAQVAGTKVRYVKPHGALYNRIAVDEVHGRAVVEAIVGFDSSLALLVLPDSAVIPIAKAQGIKTITECFADRAYTEDARLVPRSHPGAVIHDDDAVVSRALRMATDGTVVSLDGTTVRVEARSICLHSDTPNAGVLARKIRAAMDQAGIKIAPFTQI